ncbi:MAG: hypothetical protein M3220_09760, partial [Chloroflexota bacterium]|nr:hypothetical protein [Chloroflexota bacterium]
MRQKTVHTSRPWLVLILVLGILLVGTMGVYAQEEEDETETQRTFPTVELQDEDDNVVGEVDLTRTPRERLVIELDAQNFDPNRRRLAITDVGRCEAPDFDSAGDEILNLSDRRFFQDRDTFVGQAAGGALGQLPTGFEGMAGLMGMLGMAFPMEPQVVELEELTGNA